MLIYAYILKYTYKIIYRYIYIGIYNVQILDYPCSNFEHTPLKNTDYIICFRCVLFSRFLFNTYLNKLTELIITLNRLLAF